MSLQSEAAKKHIEKLLEAAYPYQLVIDLFGGDPEQWKKEYRFAPPRLFRFDYAVPAILCANSKILFGVSNHAPS